MASRSSPVAAARISALGTAVLLDVRSCQGLWEFLSTGERQALIACYREADSCCLRAVRDPGLVKRRRLSGTSGATLAVPAQAAPSTPDPIQANLQLLERKIDRLANDLQRTKTFFANRQSLLDSRLGQISAQLDAIREQVFISPAAVRLQPDLHDVFDLNCPQHVAEQAIQDSSVLLRAVRYHEMRMDSIVNILDEVQAAVRRGNLPAGG